MSDDVLITILPAIRQTRERREKDWGKIDEWSQITYNKNVWDDVAFRLLIEWIDEFTTGRFYIGPAIVAFEDDEDFVIFKLWYKDQE